ncbi:hypothetical protein K474DRAFT_1708948 [Panus rudis PR-1116 ss-1]|nr:hypothetical protein K474DRAFT_1708948 [Panus rudis PR-1116 ss-1]
MSPSRFLLPLNDTVVVFVHPRDTGTTSPHVVQITIKSKREPDVGLLSAYFLEQHDITELVLKVVSEHIDKSFPPYVVFEGSRYSLIATRRRWTYGQDVYFLWGNEPITPCQYKWTFLFDAEDTNDSDNDTNAVGA